MDYPTHVGIVGWFNIGFSVLVAFLGVFGLFFLTGIAAMADDPEAMRILGFVGIAGATFLGILALPGLFAGYGLLKRRPWGRMLGIVVAILDLFHVPIGTAFGLYSLWVLTEERAAAYFGGPPPPAAAEGAAGAPPPGA